MVPNGVLDALLGEAGLEGQSVAAWGLAWARVLPAALFVPAFGLGLLPLALRLAIGFGLALSVAPLLASPVVPPGSSWLLAAVIEFTRGIPVAVAASVSLWAAMVAGGVADHVTGASRFRTSRPALAGGTPFSTLLFLAAAVSFLGLGGAERVAARLAAPASLGTSPLLGAVRDLAAGLDLGVGIGAPLLVVALTIDLVTSIVTRELRGLRADSLAPARSLGILVATALLFDRMAEVIATRGVTTP